MLIDEVTCPFCGSVVAASVQAGAPSSPVVRRRDALTRAALTVSLVGALACGSESSEPSSAEPPSDAGASTDARVDDDAAPRDAQSAGVDDAGSIVAMYGAPGCDVAALGGADANAGSLGAAVLAASAAWVRRRRPKVSR